MKAKYLLLIVAWSITSYAQPGSESADASAPPPAAPVQRSPADLEKLVESIALYPVPLIALMLPAAAYPVEVVQAARFVSNTNNLAILDAQPWDDNVKAVARFPAVILVLLAPKLKPRSLRKVDKIASKHIEAKIVPDKSPSLRLIPTS